MTLKSNTLPRRTGKQSTNTRHSRISTVSRHQRPRFKELIANGNLPVFAPRIGRSERCHRRRLENGRAQFAGALEQEIIEKAPLDGDLRVLSGRKRHSHALAIDRNEVDASERPMR